MSISTDEKKFQTYMKLRYGVAVTIHRTASKSITKSNRKVKAWSKAIMEYFRCTEDNLFPKGRKKNGYHSMWLRYILHEIEGMSNPDLQKLFNRTRVTIMWNIKTGRNWSEVYPEVYQGIIDKYNELNKPKKYTYQLKITKHKAL